MLIQSTFDANGNRLTMTDPTGQTVNIYDTLDRLTDLTAPGQTAITFDYDALSRLINRTLPNGTDTSPSFDAASRLTALTHELGLVPFSSFTYTHDAVANRTGLTQARSAVTVASPLSYTYDELDEVTQATHPLPANPLETFTYDPAGNRLSRDGQAVNSIFDAANRLLEDDEFTYAYDANGNLETKTAKVGGAVTSYGYDAEDRLVQITFPDLTAAASTPAPISDHRPPGLAPVRVRL